MLPQARKDEILVQEVDGETLVYDLESNKAVCLNETSALIWQNCDGHRNPQEIAKAVEEKLGSPVNEEFVWFAINQLNKENLLKPKADYSDRFAGLSRRDVIKRIGLASMIALPLVASVVAPPAIHAQSCTRLANQTGCTGNNRPLGCACTGAPGGTCATGLTCRVILAGPTCCN